MIATTIGYPCTNNGTNYTCNSTLCQTTVTAPVIIPSSRTCFQTCLNTTQYYTITFGPQVVNQTNTTLSNCVFQCTAPANDNSFGLAVSIEVTFGIFLVFCLINTILTVYPRQRGPPIHSD